MIARPSQPARRAFTIVELLVVVSIIVLLIALLLPALGRARFHAREAVCASNWRQWAFAAQSYATDHGGHLPRFDIQRSIGLNVWGVGNGLLPAMGEYGVGPRMWYCPLIPQSELPWWMAPYKVDEALIENEDAEAIIAHGQSFWPEFTMTQVMWWVPRRAHNGWLPHNNSALPAASAGTGPGSKSGYSIFGISALMRSSMSVKSCPCSGVTRLQAIPPRPARAVRPMR